MTEQFKNDIDTGLSAPSKHLSSKYFYDDIGSEIFQKIMTIPEYYPTDSEFEIVSLRGKEILKELQFKKAFNVIEFGAGDGIKTIQLLKNFMEEGAEITYFPIDISKKAIDELSKNVKKSIPTIKIVPLVGDYFTILDKLPNDTANLFLFLGGNLGNYKEQEAHDLVAEFYKIMKTGDKLLIGFDLQKNPITIAKAYNDSHGMTKAFNMNLLHRINNELEADFRLDKFDFYSYYNPKNGEVNSYLVSLKEQKVHVKALNKTFSFKQNELIWTELSKKYTFSEIENLAAKTGFKHNKHFLDCKHYFTDSLWSV